MSKVENQDSGMKRGLKDRHISMIAMGGCIGTGLFMTSGGAIHDAGALGALIAYAIIGAMVFFLMTSLVLDTYGRDTSMGMELYLYSYYFRIKLFICQSIW